MTCNRGRSAGPAWTVFSKPQADQRTSSSALRSRPTCSLKCSAGAGDWRSGPGLPDRGLGRRHSAPPDWLKQLVSCCDERVRRRSATAGTFRRRRGGSLVRYLWNAAAVVPIFTFDLGGTFAIRARYFATPDYWTSGTARWWTMGRFAVPCKPQVSAFSSSRVDDGQPRCSGRSPELHHPSTPLDADLHHWFVVLLHALASTGLLVLAVLCSTGSWRIGRSPLGPERVSAWATRDACALYLWTAASAESSKRGECRAMVHGLEPAALALLGCASMHLVAALEGDFQRLVVWRGYGIGLTFPGTSVTGCRPLPWPGPTILYLALDYSDEYPLLLGTPLAPGLSFDRQWPACPYFPKSPGERGLRDDSPSRRNASDDQANEEFYRCRLPPGVWCDELVDTMLRPTGFSSTAWSGTAIPTSWRWNWIGRYLRREDSGTDPHLRRWPGFDSYLAMRSQVTC